MRDEIENPVAEHDEPNNPCRSDILSEDEVHTAEEERPGNRSSQTVRNGIVIKIEWSDGSVVDLDENMLKVEKQKDWPEQVDELSRSEEGPE
jgi:hypothetical protein